MPWTESGLQFRWLWTCDPPLLWMVPQDLAASLKWENFRVLLLPIVHILHLILGDSLVGYWFSQAGVADFQHISASLTIPGFFFFDSYCQCCKWPALPVWMLETQATEKETEPELWENLCLKAVFQPLTSMIKFVSFIKRTLVSPTHELPESLLACWLWTTDQSLS